MKLFLAALLLIACVPLALAQGTYTQIDYPGAVQTQIFGIDTAGDLSGQYVDSEGVTHGFVRNSSGYTAINYPGATNTYVYGLNDLGQVAGYTVGVPDIGFIYDLSTQTFTQVSHPHGTTLPTCINNAGDIAGNFGPAGGGSDGFELAGSSFTLIKAPHSGTNMITGITSDGELVGDYIGEFTVVSFLYFRGEYRTVKPGAYAYAEVLGINPAGSALVGAYYDAEGGFAGFLYQNGTVQTLEFPTAPPNYGSYATSINAAGEVAGVFYDAEFNLHGFTWTPAAADVKK